MKKSTLLIVLAAVLAALIIVGAVMAKSNSSKPAETEPPIVDETVPLLSGDASSLVSVEFQIGEGETFVLKKKDSSWQFGDDPDYPLNASAQNAITSAAAIVVADRLVAENPSDPAEFGFDAPSGKITVNLSGIVTVLELGDTNSFSGLTYLRVEGKPQIYAISNSFVQTFSVTKADLTKLDEKPGIDYSTVTSIVKTSPAGETVYTAVRDEDNNLTWQTGDGETVENDTVTELFTALTSDLYSGKLTGYVSPKTEDKDAAYAAYGLGEAQKTHYTVNYVVQVEIPAADEVSTSTFKDVPKAFTVSFGTDGEKTYCVPSLSYLIYEVSEEGLI